MSSASKNNYPPQPWVSSCTTQLESGKWCSI